MLVSCSSRALHSHTMPCNQVHQSPQMMLHPSQQAALLLAPPPSPSPPPPHLSTLNASALPALPEQVAVENAAEDAIAAAEARVQRATELVKEAEERAANAAAMTTAYQDISQTQVSSVAWVKSIQATVGSQYLCTLDLTTQGGTCSWQLCKCWYPLLTCIVLCAIDCNSMYSALSWTRWIQPPWSSITGYLAACHW